MNTYLGEKIKTSEGFIVQEVLGIDECIGKKIMTKENFTVCVHDNGIPSKENTHEINIKNQIITVTDVLRDCGLYLYCTTSDNKSLCINPKELDIFIEVI